MVLLVLSENLLLHFSTAVRYESVNFFNLIPEGLSSVTKYFFNFLSILMHPEIWPRGRWLYHLKGANFSFICWIMDFTLTTSSFLKDELQGSRPNTSFNIFKSKYEAAQNFVDTKLKNSYFQLKHILTNVCHCHLRPNCSKMKVC